MLRSVNTFTLPVGRSSTDLFLFDRFLFWVLQQKLKYSRYCHEFLIRVSGHGDHSSYNTAIFSLLLLLTVSFEGVIYTMAIA